MLSHPFISYIYVNSSIKNLEQVLSIPIWYNTKVVDKGIMTIGDMLDTEGQIFTLEHLRNNLLLNCDFLMYNCLRIRIQTIIGNKQILPHDNIRPRLPFILYTGLAVSSEGRFLPWKNPVSSVLEEICFFHFFQCFGRNLSFPVSLNFSYR